MMRSNARVGRVVVTRRPSMHLAWSHLYNSRSIDVSFRPGFTRRTPRKECALTHAAVSNPYRNVLLLINPIGGKGKAPSICKNTVIPILEAAGCKVQVQTTQHRYHGEEIAASVDLSKIE